MNDTYFNRYQYASFGTFTYEKVQPFIAFQFKPKNARSLIHNSSKIRYVGINETGDG